MVRGGRVERKAGKPAKVPSMTRRKAYVSCRKFVGISQSVRALTALDLGCLRRIFMESGEPAAGEADRWCVNRGGTAGIMILIDVSSPAGQYYFQVLCCRGLFLTEKEDEIPAKNNPPEVCAGRTKGKESL